MKKIIILFPRLDVPFKNLGPVPKERGPIAPIRDHWNSFATYIFISISRQHHVELIEAPLWQFTPEYVESLEYDEIFIPHKSRDTFPLKDYTGVYFYMQMVFPHMFSIDTHGWCGSASYHPIHSSATGTKDIFHEFQKRILNNQSKFDQPSTQKIQIQDYIFFPCQIPHDETIKYHSSVSVEDALKQTCEFAKKVNKIVVAKGHPVNPGSMVELKQIANSYDNCAWVEQISVHDLLKNCDTVFTVNSGVGMEAILHSKPIFRFGKSEYDFVSFPASMRESAWDLRYSFINEYPYFFHAWYSAHYDTTKVETFSKLIS